VLANCECFPRDICGLTGPILSTQYAGKGPLLVLKGCGGVPGKVKDRRCTAVRLTGKTLYRFQCGIHNHFGSAEERYFGGTVSFTTWASQFKLGNILALLACPKFGGRVEAHPTRCSTLDDKNLGLLRRCQKPLDTVF
jgi:hypothetical protein